MLWASPPLAHECHGVAPLFFSKFVRRMSPLVARLRHAERPSVCLFMGTLVAVRDSGPGIDPKHFERVFEAFYSTKSGMGMGLSICRSIIAAHGGRLWAAAAEPRGALFQFTLPSAEPASSSIAKPLTAAGEPQEDIALNAFRPLAFEGNK
jgi:hypothetical protein